MGTYLVYRACVRVSITIAKLHTNTCVCYYTLFVRWLRFVPGFLFLSILCQILVSVTRIYKVILLTDVLDLSDLRPVLIECTIVCAMLLVLLDSYTIYVEVSLCQFIGFSPFFCISSSRLVSTCTLDLLKAFDKTANNNLHCIVVLFSTCSRSFLLCLYFANRKLINALMMSYSIFFMKDFSLPCTSRNAEQTIPFKESFVIGSF